MAAVLLVSQVMNRFHYTAADKWFLITAESSLSNFKYYFTWTIF